jgi:quinol monooxygenase YgiN
MRAFFLVLLSGAMMAGVTQTSAQAPPAPATDPNAPVYVVGYIDVMPSAKNSVISAFKQFRDACRKEEGNLRCEVVQRLEQPNQFVTLQIWKDKNSFDAHASTPAATALRDKLRPLLESPYDERIHRGLSVAPPQPTPSGRPTYVVTHVDVIPPRADDAVALLGQLADATRKEPTNNRFEVLQQTNRANHFSVVELWPNRKVFEARAATPGVIQFRNQLQPMAGALYDQRLYKILD